MSGRFTRLLPLLAPLLAPAGGLLVWLAERIWPGTLASPWLAGLGAAALVAALVLNLPPFAESRAGTAPAAGPFWRSPAMWLAAPHALFVLALGFYYAGRALPSAGGAVDWQALTMGGWLLSAAAGLVLFIFVTLARLSQRRAPRLDPWRLRAAGSAGLSLGLLLVLVALLDFVFAGLPWQWDLAYFKTTRPSAATLEVVRGLSEPVDVAVFFPADSEVGPPLRSYFENLRADAGASADKLHVQFADADLKPALAEQFKARGNGWVVLRKAEVLRPVRIGDTLERARTALRTFDRTIFARLLELSRPPVVVYLTSGHGERTQRAASEAPGAGFARFRTVLHDRNYTVRDLGIAEGLGDRVPEDAGLVVSAAPSEPFLPNELEALRRYLAGGGRLLVFLEPRPPARRGAAGLGAPLETLLKEYGVAYEPVPLANDRIYARRTNTKADRSLLVTVAYQNHPSVASLRRAPGQFPLILLGAGALSVAAPPAALQVSETIRAMAGTWPDRNGDYEFDARTEKRSEPALALAISPRPQPTHPTGGILGRGTTPKPAGPTMLVFADADLASDLLLQNRANLQAVEDSLGWLVQRDTPAGPPESEEDVRIQHAKADDWLWFYLPVLGVPLAVLGFGLFWVSRQRRRPGRRDA